MSESYVLGDWGTSCLRLYRMQGSKVVARINEPGTGALQGNAAEILAERLHGWRSECAITDVTLCGMAGAPGALIAAGYSTCPADASRWLASRVCTHIGGLPVNVLPGLSHRTPEGVPEVMRGEETQVFGGMALHPELAHGRHLLILPGTHSKWVAVEDGTIQGFRTHPTGELFAILAGQSTLTGPDLPGEGTFDEGFARGLDRRGEPLSAALFEARAARMLDGRSKDWSRGYLSGLLIGGEISAAATAATPVIIIGDPELAAFYEKALAVAQCATRRLDGDATVIAGLKLASGRPV